MRHHGTYASWQTMKTRCTNPWSPNYPYYGKRGIKYEARWEVYANFLADMGERPENTTLDRVDSTGDYTKDNCRWSSKQTQARNRTNAKLTEAMTQKFRKIHTKSPLPAAELPRQLGETFQIKPDTIYRMLRQNTWKAG